MALGTEHQKRVYDAVQEYMKANDVPAFDAIKALKLGVGTYYAAKKIFGDGTGKVRKHKKHVYKKPKRSYTRKAPKVHPTPQKPTATKLDRSGGNIMILVGKPRDVQHAIGEFFGS